MRQRGLASGLGLAVAIAAARPAGAETPPTVAHGVATVIASALHESIADDSARRFALDRAELAGDVTIAGRATGQITLEAVRSAGPESAVGIDGNSILVRVKRAAVGGRWRAPHAIAIGADVGLVADPWIAALGDYPLRTLGVSVAEADGLIASADLGAAATVAVGRIARLAMTIGNGEGAHELERNRGKSTSAVATVRPPLDGLGDGAGVLEVHLYGRDGSVGPGSTRSHRLGAALAWRNGRAAAGADLVQAWGVGDRPDVTARAIEAWADVRIVSMLGASARWDRLDVDGPTDDLGRTRATAALWTPLVDGVRAMAAVQLERADGDASPIAGVPAATDATRVLFVVQGSFEGTR